MERETERDQRVVIGCTMADAEDETRREGARLAEKREGVSGVGLGLLDVAGEQ